MPVDQPSAAALAAAQGVGSQQNNPTSLVRQSQGAGNLGEFPVEAPRRPRAPIPLPTGNTPVEVGGTGQVAEHGPSSALRGSTGPAPGEIDLSTPIGAGDVARILRSQDYRFRPCYERALPAHRGLTGRVMLTFTIGRTGALTAPRATGMPEAPEVATCIAEQLRLTHFPPPTTGTLPFVFPMSFAPPPRPVRARPRPARPVNPR